MPDLTPALLELIRLTSTDLPPAVENRLRTALQAEEAGSAACTTLKTILENVALARSHSTPICQDTGLPMFYVRYPAAHSPASLRKQIRAAVAEATTHSYLRPNAVDALSGRNSGNNLGDSHFPAIFFQESDDETLTVDLMLKGGGCENVGAQYALPNARLKAGRDLDGVRKTVLDAVCRAQGEGCAPGFIGVAIGGDRSASYLASKEALLRPLDAANPEPVLAAMEERITAEANQLGIGPMGFGGKTTLLGTSIVSTFRLPASYFVSISYMCWAFRRRRMTIEGNRVCYE